MRWIVLILMMSAMPSYGQEFEFRDADEVLSFDDINTEIIGQSLEFFDGGVSKFSVGGAYSYSYFEGNTAYGSFEIGDNGSICIAFGNGFRRCDAYVRSAGRLVMVTKDGDRFPIRP